MAVDSYIPGMAAMAVPVRYRGAGPVMGCLSIAGPAVRMTPARMAAMAPRLNDAATELGIAAPGSHYFHATMKALEAGPDRQSA